MRNILKISVVTVVILSGLLMVWAKTENVETNLEAAVNIETQRGLYATHCASCHGSDGKGNTKKGMDLGVPDLTTSRDSTSKIKRVITNGDGDMPAFGKKLKAAQINSLVSYVRALRK